MRFCGAESLFTMKHLERSSEVNGGFRGISLIWFPSGTASSPPQQLDPATRWCSGLAELGGLWLDSAMRLLPCLLSPCMASWVLPALAVPGRIQAVNSTPMEALAAAVGGAGSWRIG